MRKPLNVHFCDFCGKSEFEVKQLISGPREICICCECVDLCVDIIKEEDAKKDSAHA